MKGLVLTVCVLHLALAAAPARGEDGRVEAIMNPMGGSFSQDPKVVNFAAPSFELRATSYFNDTSDSSSDDPSDSSSDDPSSTWIAADSGLALLILPEYVLEARVAARLYPWRLTDAGWFRRALYLRPGVHSLLVIDGFDAGPDLELGLAPTTRGVSLLAGVAVAGYLVNPRVLVELRFGVGLVF